MFFPAEFPIAGNRDFLYPAEMEEYHIQRQNPNECAVTHRLLAPGEVFYAAVFEEAGGFVRRDYSLEAWQREPPKNCVGYWKTRLPQKAEQQRSRMAVNDVLLAMFERLLQDPTQQDKLYVLTLLLVRRRVFSLEEGVFDAPGDATLEVECSRRNCTYSVPIVEPTPEREEAIQAELTNILRGDCPPETMSENDEILDFEALDPDAIELPDVEELDFEDPAEPKAE